MNNERTIPRAVKAVIFDLDDTLVLSTVDYAKFKALIVERLVSWGEPRSMYDPRDLVVNMVARFERRMEEAGLPPEERSRKLAELDGIMDQVEMENVGQTRAIRGALNALEMLRENGIKVGILTRGCQAYALAALANAGLAGLVDAIECRNSQTKAKPDPEAYLRLVARLGVRKEETFFVGDHPIDARCAGNAGVPFVAVETGDVSPEELRVAGCLRVFKDVGEMSEWLRTFLGNEPKK